MSAAAGRLSAALLAAAALIEVAARTSGGPGVVAALGTSLFSQFAWAGVLLAYSLAEDDRRRRRSALRLAAAAAVAVAAARAAGVIEASAAGTVALLAIGAIGVAFLARAAVGSVAGGPWPGRFVAALTFVVGTATAPFFLWLSGRVNPVDDLYVLAFEDSLGIRASVLGVALFTALPALAAAASLAYIALPAGIIALDAVSRRRGDGLVAAFALTTVAGFALYFVFPVVGPLTAFGADYSSRLPALGSVIAADLVVTPGPPRNGMPSLHGAWAFLMWFAARGLPPAPRRGVRAFAALNLLATMGLRDTHWIMDLVVALPMAVAAHVACETRQPRAVRLAALAGGAAVVAGWFAMLWWGTGWVGGRPAVSWAAIVATVAGALAVQRRLSMSIEPR